MSHKAIRLGPLIFLTIVGLSIPAMAGVLKSLDQELEALVSATEPYLVTVRGDGGWRNLVATGIVYDNAGHVITSSQITNATSFNITFKDGRSYPALKVGTDNFSGLAVLKIHGQQFSIPAWDDAGPLEGGDWVTLVGNSYDTPSTVNFGSFRARTEEGFLSLSLNASPGSSGGAVLNIDGDVVGVLVAREGASHVSLESTVARTSTYQPKALQFLEQMGNEPGRSYAVPFETARQVVDQIIKTGRVSRGYLGVNIQEISRVAREKFGIDSGVIVSEVEKGSPADSAGLRKGDIITSFGANRVECRASLFNIVRSRNSGEEIALGVLRDGQKIEMTVRLIEAGEESFLGNLGGSLASPLDASRALPAKSLNSIEFELSYLKKEIDRLQTRISEIKKELRK
jgi:serine protease Do